MFGHGFGASLVLYFSLLNNIKVSGVILSGLWTGLPNQVNQKYYWLKQWLIKVIGLHFDDMIINSFVDPCLLSEDVVLSRKKSSSGWSRTRRRCPTSASDSAPNCFWRASTTS